MDLSEVAAYSPRRLADGEYEAAVLVPVLRCDGNPHLLFTKRADHLGEHPGQMSFPGGSREPADQSLFDTAVRESHEEIGLAPPDVEPIGRLDDIGTTTGYVVTPFVARIPSRDYVPNEHEVAEIAVLPIDGLTDPGNYDVEWRTRSTGEYRPIHYFMVNGFTVWGATARILVQFLRLTTNWELLGSDEPVVDPDTRQLGSR